MGDLDFTAEAPHTVFDPTQRVERLRQELDDPGVALVAMDIILGPGVAPDPASCYVPLMKSRPDVIYVCAVCGGEGDPQGKGRHRPHAEGRRRGGGGQQLRKRALVRHDLPSTGEA